MSTGPKELHLKYRPTTFEDFIGQDEIAKSVKKQLDDDSSHSFLFTAEAGMGKTSFGRAIASYLGADSKNIIEVDAATFTGIDAVREITTQLSYAVLGANPNRVIIMDECHALSKQAWQSLLKWLEEPPKNTYWVLCTTEVGKVPPAIKTRCAHYQIDPLDEDTLCGLVEVVADAEGIEIEDAAVNLIAETSYGSPRQALVSLSLARTAPDRASLKKLLKSASEDDQVIDMCRWLVTGKQLNWKKATQYIEAVKNLNPESVRLQVLAYMTKVAISTKSDEGKVMQLMVMINCFSGRIWNQSEGMAPLALALAEIVIDE